MRRECDELLLTPTEIPEITTCWQTGLTFLTAKAARGGEAKFFHTVTSNKGSWAKLSRYLNISPCLDFPDGLQRVLLCCWRMPQQKVHLSYTGLWGKMAVKMPWPWRARACIWSSQNPAAQSPCWSSLLNTEAGKAHQPQAAGFPPVALSEHTLKIAVIYIQWTPGPGTRGCLHLWAENVMENSWRITV